MWQEVRAKLAVNGRKWPVATLRGVSVPLPRGRKCGRLARTKRRENERNRSIVDFCSPRAELCCEEESHVESQSEWHADIGVGRGVRDGTDGLRGACAYLLRGDDGE